MSKHYRYELADPHDLWPHGATDLRQVVESDGAFVYQHESGVVAVWHGGPYIDLCRWTVQGEVARLGYAFDVINVWNSYKNEPTIEKSLSGLVAEVDLELS